MYRHIGRRRAFVRTDIKSSTNDQKYIHSFGFWFPKWSDKIEKTMTNHEMMQISWKLFVYLLGVLGTFYFTYITRVFVNKVIICFIMLIIFFIPISCVSPL